MHERQIGSQGRGGRSASEPASGDTGGARGAPEDSRLVREAVRLARRGDREGMHFLYVRFAPEVHRYVAGFVCDEGEAEGVTRAVFAKLPTSIVDYQQGEARFGAWILRVARDSVRSRS